MGKVFVEICCGSAEDAVLAYKAGADRVELNSAMLMGGLTPSVGSLKVAKKLCPIPVICMVRPRAGGFCYSDMEFETMLADAEILMKAGADGLAFGVLDEHGFVDEKRNKALAEIAGNEAVFHRAFDAMAQPHNEAVEMLFSAGIKRILTSGGAKTAEEGIDAIKSIVDYSGGRIQILPGGGVRGHNVAKIVKETKCTQVHLSFHKDITDPSAGKNPRLRFSPAELPKEEVVRIVDGEGLAKFINMLHSENVY